MAVKVRGPDSEVTTSAPLHTATFPAYHLINQAFLFVWILTWQFDLIKKNGRKAKIKPFWPKTWFKQKKKKKLHRHSEPILHTSNLWLCLTYSTTPVLGEPLVTVVGVLPREDQPKSKCGFNTNKDQLMGKYLPSMYKALGSIPSTTRKIETWVELNSLLYFGSPHSTLVKGKQYVYSYLQHKKKNCLENKFTIYCHRIRKKQTALRGQLQRGGESFMVLTVSPLPSPKC